MSDHLNDVITGGLAITGAWAVVSVTLALMLGRIMRARGLNETGARRPG